MPRRLRRSRPERQVERGSITGHRWFSVEDLTNSADTVYPVELAERLGEARKVLIAGHSELGLDKINEVIDLELDAIVDISKVKKNREKIADLYVQKGYYLATVDWEVKSVNEAEVDVWFKIDEKAKVKIREVQFIGNVWGMDENAAKAAGDAADGVIFPLRTAVGWGGNAPGMKTVVEISKMSDPTGNVYRPVHYVAGVCTALYMKEAIDWAVKNGGPNGDNVAKGFYQKADWVPAGMEGVCLPSTWTAEDHRGLMSVSIYRMNVTGATDGDVADLVKNGTIKMDKVKTVELQRKLLVDNPMRLYWPEA